MRVCIVGAGVFGAWTALKFRRQGAEVTLVDQGWPANIDASSGGSHRLLRAVYGDKHIYARWSARAQKDWLALQQARDEKFVERVGVLWLVNESERKEQGDYPGYCVEACAEAEIDVARISLDDVRDRYPWVDPSGNTKAYLENPAGFLRAQTACRAVVAQLEEEGGKRLTTRVARPAPTGGRLSSVRCANDETIPADVFVFACGPWLPRLFPEQLQGVIETTRQTEHMFGVDAPVEALPPACIDFGTPIFYGLFDRTDPADSQYAMVLKLGEDTRGEVVDSHEDMAPPTLADEARARDLLGKRFPTFENAPCVYRRTCRYSHTPEGDFLIDRLPEASNVWVVGGGSSHGFKMGPEVGRKVVQWTVEESEVREIFSLARHQRSRDAGTQRSVFEPSPD